MRTHYGLKSYAVGPDDAACHSCGERFDRPDTLFRVTDYYGEDWSENAFCSRPCAQEELDEANID